MQRSGTYDDLLRLPYPFDLRHPRMSIQNRAAQFAPFAALTGHDDAVRETARLTDDPTELDEGRKVMLNEQLRLILSAPEPPEVTITYFHPDEKKAGGAYLRVTGRVKKPDAYGQHLLLTDGRSIPIERLYSIEGDIFPFQP